MLNSRYVHIIDRLILEVKGLTGEPCHLIVDPVSPMVGGHAQWGKESRDVPGSINLHFGKWSQQLYRGP